MPCASTLTASACADMFWRVVVTHHGLPLKIVSDRDALFTSHFWRTLYGRLRTHLSMTTAYHPQADGSTERCIRTVTEALRTFSSHLPLQWPDLLPSVEFAYNDSEHSATGQTPFFLDAGQHPNLGHGSVVREALQSQGLGDEEMDHVTVERPPVRLQEPTDQQAVARETLWRDTLLLARERLRAAKDLMAARHPTTWPRFAVGDSVWVSTAHLTLPRSDGTPPGPRRKLDPRWLGPFVVQRLVSEGRACALALGAEHTFHNVISVHHLLPVRQSTRFADAHSLTPPQTVVTDQGEEFEVQRIVGHRWDKQTRSWLYKVHFQGYDDTYDEWLPGDNLRGLSTF